MQREKEGWGKEGGKETSDKYQASILEDEAWWQIPWMSMVRRSERKPVVLECGMRNMRWETSGETELRYKADEQQEHMSKKMSLVVKGKTWLLILMFVCFLFILILKTQWEGGRKTEMFHLLSYLPNICNSQDWARPKPGTSSRTTWGCRDPYVCRPLAGSWKAQQLGLNQCYM